MDARSITSLKSLKRSVAGTELTFIEVGRASDKKQNKPFVK